MGVFQNLLALFRRRKISSVPITSWNGQACSSSTTITPEYIYLNIPVFRSVIDYIAKTAGQIPVGIYKDGKPFNSDFLKEPNKAQTWPEFIFDSIAKKIIFGENVIIYRKGELFNLNYCEYDHDEDGKIILPKNAISRIVPNPLDSKTSLSVLVTAKKLASRAIENLDATSNLIKNGGMGGILSVTAQNDFASVKLTENAEKEIREKFSGGNNYGKMAVIGYPFTYTKVGLNAQELGIIDFYKFDLIDVCRIFSVPSPLLNDTEHSTYNNILEAEKRFYRNVIIPEMNEFCDSITKLILEPLKLRGIPNCYFWYSTRHILALQNDVYMTIENELKLLEAGIVTIEDVKKILDR
jgi:HK97 family phage portal protein